MDAQIATVARYGAGPEELAGAWFWSLLPAHPARTRREITLGIQMYSQSMWIARYPIKLIKNATARMMPIAPSTGSVPGLTAARHCAPETVASIPNIVTSRMMIRLIKIFGYFLPQILYQ